MNAITHADGLTRCPWPKDDPLYVSYHDTEWGVPEYDDRALYEKLMLDGFQAGLSWITILRKRDNFRKAFDDFEPEKIARYTPKSGSDERRAASCATVKIEARCSSGAPISKSWKRATAFRRCVGHVDGRPKVNVQIAKQVPAETALSRAISKGSPGRGFKFVGPTIVYAFMRAVSVVSDHLVMPPARGLRRSSRAST
jgi:DNA-3-methyladenine glycosylase I